MSSSASEMQASSLHTGTCLISHVKLYWMVLRTCPFMAWLQK
jgi:hypothetical protein